MSDQNQNTPNSIDDLVKKLSGQSNPVPQAPKPQEPPKPAPAPQPAPMPQAAPSPAPQAPNQPGQYQSSIRTMTDDINSLKQGQKPAGVEMSRTISQEPPKPAPAPQPAPMPQAAPSPAPQAPKPQGISIPPKLDIPSPKPVPISNTTISIPTAQNTGGNKNIMRIVVYGILAILIVGGGMYWFVNREPAIPEPIVQPTPELPPTPPKKATLADYFGSSTPVEVKITSDKADLPSLIDSVKKSNVAPKQFTKLSLNEYDLNGLLSTSNNKIIGPLLTRWGIVIPEALEAIISGEQIVLSYGQTEAYDSKGVLQIAPTPAPSPKLVILAEIVDQIGNKDILMQSESTLLTSWTKLFGITLPKQPVSFKDNIYKQSSIRFANFPYADNSIDYAIVNAENGKTYLVLSGSRESIFATIDLLNTSPF